MKTYKQFNEGFVGGLSGFAARAAKGVAASPSGRKTIGAAKKFAASPRGKKVIGDVKKKVAQGRELAGKTAANRYARSAGSAAMGALKGARAYATQGPTNVVNVKQQGGSGFTPGSGALSTNIGRGINQNFKTFQKGTKTGALHVPGKQLKGGNYQNPDTKPNTPEKSAGGGVKKSTDGGGVQKDGGANTFTSRFRKGVTDKIKSKVKKAIGYEGDRDKAAALKKAGRKIEKDLKRPKLPAPKEVKGSLPPAKPKTLPSSGGAKPSGGSTPPQSGGGKPTGGSTPQRKDLSKTGGGQTIDVKATPVTKTKPTSGKKPTGKPSGKKPSLDDLINDVRGGSSKPKKKSNPDQLNRMAKSQAGSGKTPVIDKGEKKGGALAKSTSNLKAPKEPSKPGDSYPSKAERIAAHKKKVANLKAKGVKLREELSFWREEFIWETDKKYPDKVKQIKPMSGKNTIIINPEDESSKYSGR
jgi:hypothetical protein